MTSEEAFERAYHDARERTVPAPINWGWLEERFTQALDEGEPVAAGYCLGRLSLRGEPIADERGMLISYD